MSSKRFGAKPKKPKDKAAKKKKAEEKSSANQTFSANKAASTQQKHFQRRTSG